MDFLDYVKNIKSTFNNIEKKLSKYNKKLSFLRRKKVFLDFLYKSKKFRVLSFLSFINSSFSFFIFFKLSPYHFLDNFFLSVAILHFIPVILFSIAATEKLICFFIQKNLYYNLDKNEKELSDFFSCINNKNNFNNKNILYYYLKKNDDKIILSNLKKLINFIKNNDIDKFSIFYNFIFHSLKNCYDLKFISNDELINNVNYCIKEFNITDKKQILQIKNDINDITFDENKAENFFINDKLNYKKETIITF